MPHWVDVLPEFLVASLILAALPGRCIAVVLAADRAGAWLRRAAIHQRAERTLAAILVALGLGLAADAR